MTPLTIDTHVSAAKIVIIRSILALAVAGNVALFIIAKHVGLPSPGLRLGNGTIWVVTGFCVVLFLVAARNLHWPDRICAGLVVPVAVFALPTVLDLTVFLNPTLDPAAVAVDGQGGWWVRSLVAHAFISSGLLRRLAGAVYDLLPLWLALATLLDFQRPLPSAGTYESRRQVALSRGRFVQEFVLAGCIGYLMFALTPVVGPAAFAGTNWMDLLPSESGTAAPIPRNGMPSLLTAWTVLAFLATSGHSRLLRAVFFIIIIATVAATLGFGYHYLCDLAAAFPLVLLVRSICATGAPRNGKLGGILIGAALLLAWVAVIRGTGHLGPWSLVLNLASLVVPFGWGIIMLGRKRAA